MRNTHEKQSQTNAFSMGGGGIGILEFLILCVFQTPRTPDSVDLRAAIKSNGTEPLRRFGLVKDP